VGAGWQAVVAYVNIACYYLFGVPFGLLLGFKLEYGVMVMKFTSFYLKVKPLSRKDERPGFLMFWKPILIREFGGGW